MSMYYVKTDRYITSNKFYVPHYISTSKKNI